MSTYTGNYVNPLDMDVWELDLNDSRGMVREKGEFMLGLCERCMGENLDSRQKSVIDRCVRKLYIGIARSREKYVPVMSDFYKVLMEQPEEEAKDIALSLEFFVNGLLNIFNHQTNVGVDSLTGNITAFYKSKTEQISNPFRILGVIFVAFDSFYPFRISNSNIDFIFQEIKYRNPVFTSGFHTDITTVIVEKPLLERKN